MVATMTNMPARTVLITGPPCSGKTTYAEQHAQPGDIILDFDAIAHELGSPVNWQHPQPYRDQAEAQMRARMAHLPGTGSGTAWVIRAVPTPRARAFNARIIRATTTLVLNPGRNTCIDRANTDGRPPTTIDHIHQWYAQYRPWSHDTTITTSSSDPEPKAWGQ